LECGLLAIEESGQAKCHQLFLLLLPRLSAQTVLPVVASGHTAVLNM
jgi:hypothetical protein